MPASVTVINQNFLGASTSTGISWEMLMEKKKARYLWKRERRQDAFDSKTKLALSSYNRALRPSRYGWRGCKCKETVALFPRKYTARPAFLLSDTLAAVTILSQRSL